MRKLLPVLLLAFLTAVGCSRQTPPHVGKWDAKFYSKGNKPMGRVGTFYFAENKKVQVSWDLPPRPTNVWEGEYIIDYSKDPSQLDINWNNKAMADLHGIFRFVGEGKDVIQYVYSFAKDEPRPTNFDNPDRAYWLTKKTKR